MSYLIVTGRNSVASEAFDSFDRAYAEARRRYGDTVGRWLDLNLRIEERETARPH